MECKLFQVLHLHTTLKYFTLLFFVSFIGLQLSKIFKIEYSADYPIN